MGDATNDLETMLREAIEEIGRLRQQIADATAIERSNQVFALEHWGLLDEFEPHVGCDLVGELAKRLVEARAGRAEVAAEAERLRAQAIADRKLFARAYDFAWSAVRENVRIRGFDPCSHPIVAALKQAAGFDAERPKAKDKAT